MLSNRFKKKIVTALPRRYSDKIKFKYPIERSGEYKQYLSYQDLNTFLKKCRSLHRKMDYDTGVTSTTILKYAHCFFYEGECSWRLTSKELSSVPYKSCVELMNILFHVGSFTKALQIRNHVLKRYIEDANTEEQRYVRKYMESGEWKAAYNALKCFREGLDSKIGIFLRNIIDDKIEDNDFAREASGKKIALVGPCKAAVINDREIDSHDWIVRMNFRGSKSVSSKPGKGSRTDVAYYNGLQSALIAEMSSRNFFDETSWAVFKSEDYCKTIKPSCKSRIMVRADYPLWNCNPNMIPAVAYDLLFFRPAIVKIYHADFYLGNYDASYMHSSHKHLAETSHIREACFVHDPFAQLNFVRGLRSLEKLDCDERCGEVLDMTDEQYAVELESALRNNPPAGSGPGSVCEK